MNMTFIFDDGEDYLRFHSQVHDLDVGDIILQDSFFGEIESPFYSEFFTAYFMITFERMNLRMRQNAYDFPYNVAEFFYLEGLEVVNFDHYAEFGGELTYIK